MDDNPDNNSSYFQRTVVLRDWWLIKCSKEFEGKRFGVAGTTQIAERGAVRVFTSSPIITAFDVFTLQASDGVCIILRGFLNKQRLLQSGFLPQISSEFIFGFPPCWEAKCNDCFVGVPSGTLINKASRSIISPCNKTNLDDSPAVIVEKKTEEETDDKAGSTARDERPARQRSLRLLQSKSVVQVSKVKNKTTNHGSANLSKGAKSSDVEKDDFEEVINSKVTADNVDKVTSMSATGGESLTSELGKGELEVTRPYPHSLFEDFEKTDKPAKKAVSKKTAKNKRKHDVNEVQNPSTSDGSEVLNKAKGNGVERDECMDNEEISPVDGRGKMHSGTNTKKITSKNATTLSSAQRKAKLKVTKASLHSLPKEVSDSSKSGKNGNSKKSEKILKGGLDVVEPIAHSGSKVKDNLSVGKTIRKIDFDKEVTPEKDGKEQKITPVSADSLGQKRSKSGRLLVSSLEYWRNQVPVYDWDRNLVQVNEGHHTNSAPLKGKGSISRKPRR